MGIGGAKVAELTSKLRHPEAAPPKGPTEPLLERVLPAPILPLTRRLAFQRQVAVPRLKAMRPATATGPTPTIFIIGCGRSGTTLLGGMIGAHPDVSYLFEPYNVWAAISPATDASQVFTRGEHHCILDAGSVTPEARQRFQRLMSRPAGITLVEKSPFNTWRIGYLKALAPEAKFVHIVRDGIDVARSVERCAQGEFKIAFRPTLNPWWGVADAKWRALVADGKTAGYYAEEVDQLRTNCQRGAYEWLVSQLEVRAWRDRLGPSMVEVTYQDLTLDPAGTVAAIADAVGLSCPGDWLRQVTAWVNRSDNSHGDPVVLPAQMCEGVNSIQASYGFPGRAVAAT
jgi:Sulfotransferase family